MHFRVTGEWNGEPFNRVIEAENINDCYDHWMLWAQIAHADVTNIRIEELKEHQASLCAKYHFLLIYILMYPIECVQPVGLKPIISPLLDLIIFLKTPVSLS